MDTLKLNSSGKDVSVLQQLLTLWGYPLDATGDFDEDTDEAVRQFQSDNQLKVDGIVGKISWGVLQNEEKRILSFIRLIDGDLVRIANMLDVDVAALKAVLEVETGNQGGFLQKGVPTVLFEGHIFWQQLSKHGLNPEDYESGNEDILYPKWTKKHYKSGLKEYERLERARTIHREAADASASWGLGQIMGFNYKACGCRSVADFVEQMSTNEGKQLELFARFLQSNRWDGYLKELDWVEFARHYNGPAYAQNQYDKRLASAYKKFK